MYYARTVYATAQLNWATELLYSVTWIFAGEPNEYELALLHHAATGDIDGIKEVFTQNSYYLHCLDVNRVDYLDRTALSLAVLNGHLDIVKFLLSEEVGKFLEINVSIREVRKRNFPRNLGWGVDFSFSRNLFCCCCLLPGFFLEMMGASYMK